ncbi:MAG: hypothetical protein HYS12_03730 [Planctomycetes bacterium]|nr:hypothetical protein [Planctomycetota bacterium]
MYQILAMGDKVNAATSATMPQQSVAPTPIRRRMSEKPVNAAILAAPQLGKHSRFQLL